MLLTLRGVPVIYSGDEQGFTGDGGDQAAREDMFASQVASYNDNRLIGTNATTATDSYNPGHPLYREIATLSAIRSATPALRRGTQVTRFAGDKPGLFAVSRFDPDTGAEVLLLFNTAAQPFAGNVEIDPRTTAFTSLAGDCPARVTVAGSVAVTLPPLGYAICAGVKR
jgi:glycosidase